MAGIAVIGGSGKAGRGRPGPAAPVVHDDKVVGALSLEDAVRRESREAVAELGVAIGAGTDVAIESAGIVLAANDPRGVLGIIRLSQASYRKMLQNLGWATGYNLLAVPVATGALAWAGITLAPAVGAVLMSLTTIVVARNAQLLRGLDLQVQRRGSP